MLFENVNRIIESNWGLLIGYRFQNRLQLLLVVFRFFSLLLFLVSIKGIIAGEVDSCWVDGDMGYLNSVLSSSNQVYAEDGPVSGGGLSQNGKFSYGYASSPGKRSSMEDFYETRIDGVEGEIVGLFGVFDGHGGARAAEYVKQNLFSNLINHPKFISDTKSAIADAYNHTDSEFLKSENTQNRDAGSTASTAILVGDRLLVANVGDSRAVICRGGNAIAVSRDHKPDQTDERQRIEDAGGFVMWAGSYLYFNETLSFFVSIFL
ncbi:unnamed protein product [Linum tenue]|uniref:protein-serine/threonine phosphatase n=1 Tax=Linum tenue TaxID=586396 RepID=A0AAV0GV91_9ROSI|nr:unnamed protein product [Linum tenue]